MLLILASFRPHPLPSRRSFRSAKIWDQGNHNAFTDLIRWHDQWYCSFREADGHVGGDGNCAC